MSCGGRSLFCLFLRRFHFFFCFLADDDQVFFCLFCLLLRLPGLLTGGCKGRLDLVQLLPKQIKLHVCIHQLLLQIFHLVVQAVHLTVQIRNGPFQFLSLPDLLLKFLLRLDLSLRYFLHKDLPDLHVRNIPVFHNLLFDLFDEFRFHRLPVFLRDLMHASWIRFQKTFEHRIVGDEVYIHL